MVVFLLGGCATLDGAKLDLGALATKVKCAFGSEAAECKAK